MIEGNKCFFFFFFVKVNLGYIPHFLFLIFIGLRKVHTHKDDKTNKDEKKGFVLGFCKETELKKLI